MMLITELGEFGLIERFRRQIKTDSSVVVASGDDCAVLEFDRYNYQLFTCDMIVTGVDFTLKDDPYLVGRKALAVSISDIAACAGIPRHCVVSLGIPKDTTVSYIDKVAKGVFDLAKVFKINVVGGDISRAKNLVIDVSIIGIVEKKCLLLRSNAKAGDIIFVTGELGGAIRGKHLEFIPRIKESRYLVKNFTVNSMIDISDGLAQDLNHILEASKVGGVLYETLLPLSKEANSLRDALFSGEDYELLFTLPKKAAKKILIDNPLHFKPIGEVMDKKYGFKLITKSGKEKDIAPFGYRHF